MSDSDYEPDEEKIVRSSKRVLKEAHVDDDNYYEPKKKQRADLSKLPSSPEYSKDSDDLTSVNIMDCERIPEQNSLFKLPKAKKDQYTAWCQFIFFSQQESRGGVDDGQDDIFCSSWNPYTADMSKVGAYLKILKTIFQYSEDQLTIQLRAITGYLLRPGVWCPAKDLVDQCQLDMDKVPSVLVSKMKEYHQFKIRNKSKGMKVFNKYGERVWHRFVNFCRHTAAVDPFLAKPEDVANFVVGMLLNRDDQSSAEDERIFRPYIDFYTENSLECFNILKFKLKIYHMVGDDAIMKSNPIQRLLEAARSLDSREEPPSSDLAARLRPCYWYTDYKAKRPGKSYWRHELVRRVLADVGNKVISLAAAAWQLGVPPSMIRAAISREGKDEEVDFTIGQYVDRGFGSEEQFWGESSTLALLEDVRDEKTDNDSAAFKLGVSAKKLVIEVGKIKTKEQVQAEKLEKQENEVPVVKVKKMTDLQKQIVQAEKNEHNLSDYEKLRLRNMRDRQELLTKLNFEEKENLPIKRGPRIFKPIDYGVREKSSRIKRRAEEAELKSLVGAVSSAKHRQTPEWVGLWTPLRKVSEKKTTVAHGDLTQEMPIPDVDMELTEVLAVGQNYHIANRFLERLGGELRDWCDMKEPHLVTPAWGSFEQVKRSRKVCEAEILSVSTWEDLVSYGDQSGGVGVRLGGQCLALQPHNRAVSRVVFVGTEDRAGLSLVSASLDGTVRATDLVTQQITLERDLAGKNREEVRWLEPEDANSWLVNLGGREVRRVDRREKGARVVVELAQEEGEGSNIGRHPTLPNMISLCQGTTVCLYDLRHSKNALEKFNHTGVETHNQSRGFAGSNWSRVSGRYLLGCQIRNITEKPSCYLSINTYNSGLRKETQSPVVWDLQMGSSHSPVLEWPGGYRGASYSRFYGASWCPWTEEVFLTSACTTPSGKQTKTVVAIDVSSGSVLADLAGDLCHSSYVIECHNDRHEVVVANSGGPGYLASFKFSSDSSK